MASRRPAPAAAEPARPAATGPTAGLPGGTLMPWLDEAFQQARRLGAPPALLIHGAEGLGQYELALALASAALCESPEASETDATGQTPEPGPADPHPAPPGRLSPARPGGRACGHCPACHLLRAGTHPDLKVLLPEELQGELAWGGTEDTAPAAAEDGGGAKAGRKPSREIRVEALRGAVAFAQQTSARGGAKLVLIFPAERMNAVAANTLLKTLEEPPPGFRFILGSAAPQRLLPTVRSRCRSLVLRPPVPAQAGAWLQAQGLAEPELLLAAAGGAPLAALARHAQGLDAALWRRLPAELQAGRSSALAELPLPLLIDALAKLAEDLARRAVAAPPRHYPVEALPVPPPPARLKALADWAHSLRREARHADHPWHAGLALEALVARAQAELAPPAAAGGAARRKFTPAGG